MLDPTCEILRDASAQDREGLEGAMDVSIGLEEVQGEMGEGMGCIPPYTPGDLTSIQDLQSEAHLEPLAEKELDVLQGSPLSLEWWMEDVLEERWFTYAAHAKILTGPREPDLSEPLAQVEVGLNNSDPLHQDG